MIVFCIIRVLVARVSLSTFQLGIKMYIILNEIKHCVMSRNIVCIIINVCD
jgi:hypothetical protein